MGNKAAGGPFQLEVPNGEVPGFHVGAMSGNAREEGCTSAAIQATGAADASDGSGDDERAYASPAEAEEEVEAEVEAPVTEERNKDTNFSTRYNGQSSWSNNNRLSGSATTTAAVATGAATAGAVAGGATSDQPIPGAAVTGIRSSEQVPPPPSQEPSSAAVSVSPPRAPGGSDLQLPPLNDPHPIPGSEEVARLAARGSPSSADGRDQKGAQ